MTDTCQHWWTCSCIETCQCPCERCDEWRFNGGPQ